MQELGELLERLGPVFALVFLALVIGVGVVLVMISTARLVKKGT